jgi:hypothetical protein
LIDQLITRVISGAVASSLLLGATACGGSGDHVHASAASPTVQTSFPGLPAPTGEPELAGIVSAAPATGTVAWVDGPFDDRFTTSGLSFDGSAVSGSLLITSDVSDILELQVLAGFYDADGHYLGEARFTHHLDEGTHADSGPPSESAAFRIRVPRKFAKRAESAAVGVPVLVNE